jgi:gamma-glutamylputrescine oxidase
MSHHATDKVFWYTTAPTLQTKLQHDIKTEVVVVGGGMAGLVAAHTLVKSGKKVTLLEASFVGAGASGKSSGFITPDSELELGSMISNHGPEKARKLWEFVCSGVENIRSLIQAYNIECGYQVQDSVFISNGPHKDKKVFEEHEARESLSYESRLYTRPQHIIGSDSYSSAVRYGGTFGINAYQFCQAMKSVLMSLGVEVFEQTPVTEIKTDGVLANGHNVTAEQIVLCTDRLLPELGILKKDVYNVQTFLGITKPLKPEIMKRLFPDGPLMV